MRFRFGPCLPRNGSEARGNTPFIHRKRRVSGREPECPCDRSSPTCRSMWSMRCLYQRRPRHALGDGGNDHLLPMPPPPTPHFRAQRSSNCALADTGFAFIGNFIDVLIEERDAVLSLFVVGFCLFLLSEHLRYQATGVRVQSISGEVDSPTLDGRLRSRAIREPCDTETINANIDPGTCR